MPAVPLTVRCLTLLSLVALAACAAPRPAAPVLGEPRLTAQTSGTDALLIAAHAVDDRVVWAAGTGGTVARTTDGGATWTAMRVPGADTLQFRDVHAFGADAAVVLSIGPGAASRIFRTGDGGATWQTVFVNAVPEAFYDCLAFWDDRHGLAFSDGVGGALPIVTTDDGGRTWTPLPAAQRPSAAEGEGSFAASGTCVATEGARTAWIGTGNGPTPRVLRTDDRGATWSASSVPVEAGEAAGVASVVFLGAGRGLAAGGNIGDAEAVGADIALTDDGGRTWRPGGRLPFGGAVYGAARISGTDAVLAVGPGGAALSRDGGASWSLVSAETHWGLTATAGGAWLVGPGGRVTRVTFAGR